MQRPVPIIPPVPPETYTRYGVLCCRRCNYAKIYCACIPLAAVVPSQDAVASNDLQRRIDACRGK